MAKPVWRQAMTSAWSPKIDRAWAGQRAGGDVENAGEQFAGDLVHVGDHQQQALRRSVGGRQSAGCQRAVHDAGRAAFRLHLDDIDRLAEDVLAAFLRPLVGVVGHRR